MDCHVSEEPHLSDKANDDDGSKVEYPALQRLVDCGGNSDPLILTEA